MRLKIYQELTEGVMKRNFFLTGRTRAFKESWTNYTFYSPQIEGGYFWRVSGY